MRGAPPLPSVTEWGPPTTTKSHVTSTFRSAVSDGSVAYVPAEGFLSCCLVPKGLFLPSLAQTQPGTGPRQTGVCQRVDICLGGSEELCDILAPPQNIISVCLKVHH